MGDAGAQELGAAIVAIGDLLRADGGYEADALRDEIQARMSDHAGPFCYPENVTTALSDARALNAGIAERGLSAARPSQVARVLQWRHMALASEAVLAALDYYIADGGGSRGARAICDPTGEAVPATRIGPVEDFRFRQERDTHKDEQILVRCSTDGITVETRRNRHFDETAKTFFERDWPDWLTGSIYGSQAR